MTAWTQTQDRFRSWDHTPLFYRTWEPSTSSRRAIVFIHRGHEHSGRIEQLVTDFGLTDFWAFSWDNRGHGLSPGKRGHANHYDDLVKDLDAFVKHITEKHDIPVENIALVANSVGAVTAVTWVHDYAPRIRAMVLAAPAFRIKLYVPLAVPLLRQFQRIKPTSTITSYVKSSMLTHDPNQARQYDQDPLITRTISTHVLLGLHDTATRILADAGTITTATQVLTAGADHVVKQSPQHRFYHALSSPRKEHHTFAGFRHALFYDKDRQRPIAKARTFIENAFAHPQDTSFLLRADQQGATKDEYDALCRPASPVKQLAYRGQQLSMKTLGRLSKGIRLGWKTGFDSGLSLDYVYENKAQGCTPLGRWMDRCYLNTVGWEGIRQRADHLKSSIKEACLRLEAQGRPVHILDVAAGCGRYIMETVKDQPSANITVELRDNAADNLSAGQRLAETWGLQNVIFTQADAFDPESICAIDRRPNLVIVSGLYELFPDNQKVLESLSAVSDILAPHGFLIYTGQPWHPQVEMIARTLANRNGRPWIMRRRSQAELDELVHSVGIQKTSMKIDHHGIFTVSVAQKRSLS